MRGVRIPHDLNGQDRFALGLSVTSLAGLLFGLLAAYTILHLHIALPLRVVFATVVAGAAAALAWLRPEGRSLGHWLMAAIEFKLATEIATPDLRSMDGQPRLSVVDIPDHATASTPDGDADEDIVELPTGPAASVGVSEESADPVPVPVYMGSPQVVTFFSAKGGTGRTTLMTETACLLARSARYRESPVSKPRRLRVILADFDQGSANVSVRLGMVQPTILDYLTETTAPAPSVTDYVRRHAPSGLDVLLGPPKCLPAMGSRIFDAARALEVLSALRASGYKFIFVDLGSNVGEFELQVLQAADRIYCVVNPTASAVQDLYRSVEALRRLGLGSRLNYVANRVADRSDFTEAMGDLGGTLSARIPDDPGFDAAENRHRPLVLHEKGGAAEAIWRLAASVYPALGVSAASAGSSRLNWLARRRHAS